MRGTRPDGLLAELSALGSCRLLCHSTEFPLLDQIVPEHCYGRWDAVLSTDRGIDAIRDVFIFVEDDSDLKIEEIELDGEDGELKRFGEIMIDRGYLSRRDIKEVLSAQKSIGKLLVESKKVSPEKVESALHEQEVVREA